LHGLTIVDPDDRSIIFADNRVPPEWRAVLKDLKHKLRPPKDPKDAPAEKFLRWHKTERFGVETV
jgi:predicted alternative tryptophan synthase beta-subunit